MPVVSSGAVAMLRGVNVGGHNKMGMDALRDLAGSLGLRDARTYIQSGNLVFATEDRDMAGLAKRIAAAIEGRFGFRPGVICRTTPELREAVARNPFGEREGIDASRLLIHFLAGEPEGDLAPVNGVEELVLRGRELYVYYPNGVGQSRLSMPGVERRLKTTGTGRNWNTVLKMLEMAEGL